MAKMTPKVEMVRFGLSILSNKKGKKKSAFCDSTSRGYFAAHFLLRMRSIKRFRYLFVFFHSWSLVYKSSTAEKSSTLEWQHQERDEL